MLYSGVKGHLSSSLWKICENGGVWLSGLSRILAELGQCRDKHRSPCQGLVGKSLEEHGLEFSQREFVSNGQ